MKEPLLWELEKASGTTGPEPAGKRLLRGQRWLNSEGVEIVTLEVGPDEVSYYFPGGQGVLRMPREQFLKDVTAPSSEPLDLEFEGTECGGTKPDEYTYLDRDVEFPKALSAAIDHAFVMPMAGHVHFVQPGCVAAWYEGPMVQVNMLYENGKLTDLCEVQK